jgi:hypothetical protein
VQVAVELEAATTIAEKEAGGSAVAKKVTEAAAHDAATSTNRLEDAKRKALDLIEKTAAAEAAADLEKITSALQEFEAGAIDESERDMRTTVHGSGTAEDAVVAKEAHDALYTAAEVSAYYSTGAMDLASPADSPVHDELLSTKVELPAASIVASAAVSLVQSYHTTVSLSLAAAPEVLLENADKGVKKDGLQLKDSRNIVPGAATVLSEASSSSTQNRSIASAADVLVHSYVLVDAAGPEAAAPEAASRTVAGLAEPAAVALVSDVVSEVGAAVALVDSYYGTAIVNPAPHAVLSPDEEARRVFAAIDVDKSVSAQPL